MSSKLTPALNSPLSAAPSTGDSNAATPVATPENSINILGNVVVTDRPLSANELKFIRRVNRTGTLPPKLARVPKPVLKNTGLFDDLPDALLIGLGLEELIDRIDNFFRIRRKIGGSILQVWSLTQIYFLCNSFLQNKV